MHWKTGLTSINWAIGAARVRMMAGLSIRCCPPASIPDVKLVEASAHADPRGYFSEVFKHTDFAEAGLEFTIRQISQSFSVQPGTMRGLHFQTPAACAGQAGPGVERRHL